MTEEKNKEEERGSNDYVKMKKYRRLYTRKRKRRFRVLYIDKEIEKSICEEKEIQRTM